MIPIVIYNIFLQINFYIQIKKIISRLNLVKQCKFALNESYKSKGIYQKKTMSFDLLKNKISPCFQRVEPRMGYDCSTLFIHQLPNTSPFVRNEYCGRIKTCLTGLPCRA